MINRNRNLSVTFAATAALIASVVLAAEPEWQEVTRNAEAAIEVDAASIRVREGMLTAWVRVTAPRDIGTEGSKFRSTVSLTVFDCDAGKSGVSATTTFAGPRGEGKKVHEEEGFPVPFARLRYERPGTEGYKVLEFVCERAGRPGTASSDATKLRSAEAAHATNSPKEAGQVGHVPDRNTPAQITVPANPDDYYPPGSIRREEQGSPIVQVCVDPSGKPVREPLITNTSGFPDLDDAAIQVAKATRYKAGTENGNAVPESCLKFKIKFSLNFH
jgi:TonB family protein